MLARSHLSPEEGSPCAVFCSLCASVAIADLNQDGLPDLAVASEFSNNMSVLLHQ